jgi:biotin carboxyl carrier protein
MSNDNSYSLHYRDQQIHISDLRQNTSCPQRCDGHARWQFIYGGAACTAETLYAGQHISLSIAGLSIDSRSGDNRTANRTNWQFEVLDYIAAKKLDVPQNTLIAPMTATVTAILVKNGEKVKAGQSLILLEAMKMEQSLKALQEGEIARILVEPGQGVNEGDILLEYKDTPGKDAPEPKNS